MIFWNARQPRNPPGPPLAGYPAPARRLIFWWDSLTDWQRLQYAAATILFLFACAGYLLGLGSTMVVQRFEMESAAMAAVALPTVEPILEPTPPPLAVAVPITPPTARPSPTLEPAPTATPFSSPRLAEPPAVPRAVPAAPAVIAPAPVRATATPDRPRNVESQSSVVPTRTPAPVATPAPTHPTVAATLRPAAPSGQTPLPTLALPATRVATGPAPLATATPTPRLSASQVPTPRSR